MKYRVVIEPPAEADMDAIYLWLARNSREQAHRWFHRMVDATEKLSVHPKRCAIIPESDLVGEEIRQLLVGKRPHVYQVLFTIARDTVHIVHVRHSARGFSES